MQNVNLAKFLFGFTLCMTFAAYTDQRHIAKDAPFNCSPVADPRKPQFIVGYGSLLQDESKNRTHPNTGENIPVTVKGFSRQWNARGAGIGLGTTYLGVIDDPDSNFNGIVFQLGSKDILSILSDFDLREEWYCRRRVNFDDLDFSTWNSKVTPELKKGEFWIYINKPEFTEKPSKEYPIVQSYVDIFIGGCLQMEQKHGLKNYAEKCISTTQGWSVNWVNDRIYPRRPFVYVKNAGTIDKLLSAGVPKIFGRIQVE